MSFKIQIGSIEREYVLRRTNAPENYDSFGTMTVYSPGEKNLKESGRIVLIQSQHLKYHEGRYGSGMHFCHDDEDMTNDPNILKWVEDKLFSAMISGLAKDIE